MTKYNVVGLMSGTSLDGLDIACCTFLKENDHWQFELKHTQTIPYPDTLKHILKDIVQQDKQTILDADTLLGEWYGNMVKEQLELTGFKADFIASHGHTVFHQPEKGFTLQIGSGELIMQTSNLPVINDFRSNDVSMGGQGAPLVPIGDLYLFDDYEVCLNLGGIANLSFNQDYERIAYDITFANLVLNYLSNILGHDYDNNGAIAARGTCNTVLLQKINELTYFSRKGPKSLGIEWVKSVVLPLFLASGLSIQDQLATAVEHIAQQIARDTILINDGKLLITGGGALNSFLVERIKNFSKHEIIIPERRIIDFKEALIFAFLGVLRARNENNCLRSVTGAREDNMGGVIFGELPY